jgi:hypothetical protein
MSRNIKISGSFVTLSLLLMMALTPLEKTHAFAVGVTDSVNCGPGQALPCLIADTLKKQYAPIHQNITASATDNITYTTPSGEAITFGLITSGWLQQSDRYADADQSPEIHYDDEQAPASNALILKNTKSILDTLSLSPEDFQKLPAEEYGLGNGSVIQGVRAPSATIGRTLHTIQDFYSHSNWIFIQKYQPVLTMNIPAPWSTAPEYDSDNAVFSTLDISRPTCEQSPISAFPSIPPLSNINNQPYTDKYIYPNKYTFLTTGYAVEKYKNNSGVNLLDAIAPANKCAHGLSGNGIHKDWPGRDSHEDAVWWATKASQNYLNYLFAGTTDKDPANDTVVPDNVCTLMSGQHCAVRIRTYVPFNLPITAISQPSTPTGYNANINCSGVGVNSVCNALSYSEVTSIAITASAPYSIKGVNGCNGGLDISQNGMSAICTIKRSKPMLGVPIGVQSLHPHLEEFNISVIPGGMPDGLYSLYSSPSKGHASLSYSGGSNSWDIVGGDAKEMVDSTLYWLTYRPNYSPLTEVRPCIINGSMVPININSTASLTGPGATATFSMSIDASSYTFSGSSDNGSGTFDCSIMYYGGTYKCFTREKKSLSLTLPIGKDSYMNATYDGSTATNWINATPAAYYVTISYDPSGKTYLDTQNASITALTSDVHWQWAGPLPSDTSRCGVGNLPPSLVP